MALIFRLRKHADYQRVYQASRKQFSRQMTYFVASREASGVVTDLPTPRVGLTVGKVMGKAVDRNRIKRRMREAIRRNIALLDGPIDVILHPRRSVLEIDFPVLEREVAQVFAAIRKNGLRPAPVQSKALTPKNKAEASPNGAESPSSEAAT
jgi:ribonuclease P protein component